MIPVTEVYQDCADQINVQENGSFGYDLYNRFAWRGQLRLIDWLSGDVSGIAPPEPYRSQKNRDWLAPFVKKFTANVVDGVITRPEDYYLYQDMYLLRGINQDCEDERKVVADIPITLLDNSKFKLRAKTYIESLKPTNDKPITKQVGETFEFEPKDVGSLVLEYVRYPKKAFIVPKLDTVLNEEIPDEDKSVDFEWGEFARDVLTWFVVDAFSNRVREQAAKQNNILSGKDVRAER